MKTIGPTQADIAKLHSEINQISNQRFVITTLAITITGGFLAWTIPRGDSLANEYWQDFAHISTTILSAILVSLYVWSSFLRRTLRIYTTYLALTDNSGWEKDWAAYRSRPYFAHTRPQATIFILLIVLSSLFSTILAYANGRPIHWCSWATLINFSIGGVGIVIVFGLGYLDWFLDEAGIKKRWESVTTPR